MSVYNFSYDGRRFEFKVNIGTSNNSIFLKEKTKEGKVVDSNTHQLSLDGTDDERIRNKIAEILEISLKKAQAIKFNEGASVMALNEEQLNTIWGNNKSIEKLVGENDEDTMRVNGKVYTRKEGEAWVEITNHHHNNIK